MSKKKVSLTPETVEVIEQILSSGGYVKMSSDKNGKPIIYEEKLNIKYHDSMIYKS